MRCGLCGQDNLAEALFCPRCGSLMTASEESRDATRLRSATHEAVNPSNVDYETGATVPLLSPSVILFIVGLIVASWFARTEDVLLDGYYFVNRRVVLFATFVEVLGFLGGLTVAFWAAQRLRWHGRLLSVGGAVLFVVISFRQALGSATFEGAYSGPGALVLNAAMVGLFLGIAAGLLLPLGFWRGFGFRSRVARALVGTVAGGGAAIGFWVVNTISSWDGLFWAAAVLALLVGLPAVWISPPLRRPPDESFESEPAAAGAM